MAKKILLILHGPNLNLLGEREPEVYGTQTLDELNAELSNHAAKQGFVLAIFQSNNEGALIDLLHEHRQKVDGVVFNPGAFAHYSYALRDAISSILPKVIEVHLSDIANREEFRKVSVLSDVCVKQISGLGILSYKKAIDLLINLTEIESSNL